MCGLIGIAVAQSSKITSHKLGLFLEAAALVGTTRGQDGTGIAVVTDSNRRASVYKEGIPGWNFLDTKTWSNAKSSLYEAEAALLHTRKATIGTSKYSNTHPFVSGPITLEHNGTLRVYPKGYDTDSAFLCEKIAKAEDVLEALATTNGAYALVWHDARDGTINLARNNERPLVVVTDPTEGLIMWASEEWMLAACAGRIGLSLAYSTVEDLPIGELRSIKLGRNLEVTKRIYTPHASPAVYPFYTGNNGYNPPASKVTGSVIALPPPKVNSKLNLPEGWALGTRLTFCAEEIKVSSKGSVMLEGAVMEDTEDYVEANAFLRPKKEWDKYANVREPVFTGAIIGHHSRKTLHKSGTDQFHLVVTLGDLKFLGAYNDIEHTLDPAIEALYEGPWGEKITAQEVQDFLVDGCSACRAPLYVKDVEEGNVTWDINGDPLCNSCK